MFGFPFILPLSDFKSVAAPSQPEFELHLNTPSPVLLTALILAVVVLVLLFSPRPARRTPHPPRKDRPTRRPNLTARRGNWIVVDGSNVMHWQDSTPRLAPVLQVVNDLQARGFDPGVVFDANAGWKLFGRYLNESELGRMLGLPTDQVLVVPKGTQADPYILATARVFKARIVTNDRYRDWASDYPEIAQPGHLIRGEMQGDSVRLKGVDLPATAVS